MPLSDANEAENPRQRRLRKGVGATQTFALPCLSFQRLLVNDGIFNFQIEILNRIISA